MIKNEQSDKIMALLKTQNIDYSLLTDDFNFETALSGANHYGLSLDETAPTLILKSKGKYYAAIISGNTRLSFKKLKKALGVKDISLADPQTVHELTGAKVGEVSLINSHINTLIDKKVLNNKYCYGGSGEPKATLRINTSDLLRITDAQVFDFTEPRI